MYAGTSEEDLILPISYTRFKLDSSMLLLFTAKDTAKPVTVKKDYTPIKSYKPSGNLVYDDDLLSQIEDKFS